MSEESAPGPKESPPAARQAGSREVWKKGGRLLSVLLAVNVLLLACTLISGGAFNKVAVYDTDVFALLTSMMLLASLWILFYLLRTVRCPDAVPYRDAHAGPVWLRGAGGGGGGVGRGQERSQSLGLSEELWSAHQGRGLRNSRGGGGQMWLKMKWAAVEREAEGKQSWKKNEVRDGGELLCSS